MTRSNWLNYGLPIDRRTLALISGLVAFSLIVGTNSRLVDAARNGLRQLPTEIWLLEASSHLVILALAAVFPLFLDRVPERVDRKRIGMLSLAGFAGFSILHVTLTYSLRDLLFPAFVGRSYELHLLDPRVWFYELPKDALTFALVLAAFIFSRVLSKRSRESNEDFPKSTTKVILRSGSSVRLVPALDIIHARAAGNYVEVFTSNRSILARMTMLELERTLARANTHVRVHRSYLVHLDHIIAVSPNGEGNVVITLSDGTVVPGSRRYRSNLSVLE
jgi:hypothetical protein